MATYLMLGKYTPGGIAGATPARTKEISDLISQCGGKVESMYALTGDQDLAFLVDFPTTEDVLRASFELAKSTGISFNSNEAVPVAQFDRLISSAGDAAKGARRQVTVRA
jgi:uncharacterized protein with GYD domain